MFCKSDYSTNAFLQSPLQCLIPQKVWSLLHTAVVKKMSVRQVVDAYCFYGFAMHFLTDRIYCNLKTHTQSFSLYFNR